MPKGRFATLTAPKCGFNRAVARRITLSLGPQRHGRAHFRPLFFDLCAQPVLICVLFIFEEGGGKIAHRTLIVGLDGATWDVLGPLLAGGYLPNLARVQRQGAFSKLSSSRPPLSPPAWASFMTGCNPGKSNIFDFVGRNEQNGFSVSHGSQLGAPTFWQLLSREDKKVVVINVPMTYPPEAVNGVLVAGMDAPFKDRPATFPTDFSRRITEKFGRYRVAVPMRPRFFWQKHRFVEQYTQELIAMTTERLAVARWLWQEVAPDFMMVVFVATDRIQHVFGQTLAAFRDNEDPAQLAETPIGRIYRVADEALGTLWSEAAPANLFVMSDHGFQPYDEVLSLNSWLAANGYLRIDWDKVKPKQGHRYRQALLRRLGKGERQGDLMDRAPFFRAIDWQHTTAFSFGAFGTIFLNIAGRDRFGIVQPGAEADRLRREIGAKLLALHHPRRGTPLIHTVWRNDEVYHGPYADRGPDLLVETAPGIFVRNGLDQPQRELLSPADIYPNRTLPHTGMHHPDGILLAAGPDIAARGRQTGARIIDLAPTVLALHDTPIPHTMDGRPLLSWLSPAISPSFREDQSSAAGQGSAYNDEDESAIEERLASLGYL